MSSPLIPPALNRTEYLKFQTLVSAQEPGQARRIKVAVLASFTVDFWKPYLIVEAARRDLGLDLWLAPYGQIEQQAFDPQSDLFKEQPDVVVILPRLEDLAPDLAWGLLRYSAEAALEARKTVTGRLASVVENIRQQGASKIVLGNFAAPAWCSTGFGDAGLENSEAAFIQGLNQELAIICAGFPDVTVLDVARAARQVGTNHWRDERMAWLAKAPLSHEAMVALAQMTARRIRPWFHPPKKCLVLDMDNTLWGGVLGEAGIHGIQLGADYPGNVFVDFQRRVLALRDQGVILAAASKNNAADVELVLESHPACLLKKQDFAAFEVHWEDKATSLRRIAATLNIGTDALVFFDDNPVERAWVTSQMPEVTVLDVPSSATGYGKLLEDCGCFDSVTLTDEDRRRAELYRQQATRDELRVQSGSLDDFIRSLKMTVTVGAIDETVLPRVAQLLGKTNQFNLTTRRHSPAEIQQMLADGAVGIYGRVQDQFGDSGLVAVAIARPATPTQWRVDTFLMSCRVIGRQVETAMLATLERLVKERGATELVGEYIPTAKNQPASDFFEKHGYESLAGTERQWRTSLDALRSLPEAFEISDLASCS